MHHLYQKLASQSASGVFITDRKQQQIKPDLVFNRILQQTAVSKYRRLRYALNSLNRPGGHSCREVWVRSYVAVFVDTIPPSG